MPDVSLSSIEFVIKGDSDQASSSVNELRKRLDQLSTSLSKASGVNKLSSNLREIGNAAKDTTKKTNEFVSSIMRIAKYRMIRSVIRAITSAFQEGLKNAYQFSKMTGGALAESLDQVATASLTMKNQLGAAFGGLLQIITPIILTAISLITKLASAISMLFGMFSGSGGWLKATDAWTEWGEAAEGAGGAAKEALKYLAPFDELNVLPSQKQGGGGGGDMGDIGDMFEWVDFEDGSLGQKISDFIKENLESIEALADLFMFATGLILVCSGANIPLGLGLMAVGGYKLYQDISENWDAISQQLQGTMGVITGIIGASLMAIGLILTLSGANIPVGLALIATGATALATAVAVNWDGVSDQTRSTLGTITSIVGGALLAIGFLLAMSVNPATVALGIGLIAAGAVSLAAAAYLNWDSMGDKVGSVVKTITGVVSGAVLAVGALLTFSGVNIPLGLGLMAAGAIGIVATAGVNWETMKEKLTGPIGEVVALISSAALLLGILCIVGGNWGLGLGLVLAGAGGLAATVGENWDKIAEVGKKAKEKFKAGWDSVSEWVDARVKLVKDGWTTVKDWIDKFNNEDTEGKVKLVRDTWTTVWQWITDKFQGSTIYKHVKLFREGWTTVWKWITDKFLGGNIYKHISLFRDGWKTVWQWITDKFQGSNILKKVELARNAWTTVWKWIVDSYAGTNIKKSIDLARNGWTTVWKWVKDSYLGTNISKAIDLARNGWTTVVDWISDHFLGGNLRVLIDIIRGNTSNDVDFSDQSFTASVKYTSNGLKAIPAQTVGVNVKPEDIAKASSAVGLQLQGFNYSISGANDDAMSEDALYRVITRALADSTIDGEIDFNSDTMYAKIVQKNRQHTRMTGVNALG